MEVTFEKTAPCVARIQFTVPSPEFEGEVRRALAQLGRRTRMKGFRPGHVPPAVVERQFGKDVRQQVRRDYVQKAYERAVQENELKPISQPRVELDETDAPLAGQDFSLDFEVTLKPEFELGTYTGLEIAARPIAVSDQELEGTIAQLRRNQARPEPVGDEGLGEDGMALCKVELIHQGQVVWQREGLRLGPGTTLPGVEADAFRRALLGTKDGSTFELPLRFPDDFENEAARGQEGTARVGVTQAFRIVEATQEELCRLLEAPDEATLREKVRERILEAAREQEQRRIEGELIERLVASHEIDLPERMVEEQAKARLAQARSELENSGLAGPEVEEELSRREVEVRESAERSCRAYFLIEAIAEKEQLKVSEAELRTELKAIAERNRASLEEVRDYYQEQNLFPQLAMEIVESKVRRFLREQATPTPAPKA